MIRLRISRRALRAATWIVLAASALAGLYSLGTLVTPRDDQGHPLLLSPSLHAAERYRSLTKRWAERMSEIDRSLTALLAAEETTDPAELVAQGQTMESIGEEATELIYEMQTADAPVALAGLRAQAQEAADAYLEAALCTARWLGEPSDAGRRKALEALRTARALRVFLEGSQWLAN